MASGGKNLRYWLWHGWCFGEGKCSDDLSKELLKLEKPERFCEIRVSIRASLRFILFLMADFGENRETRFFCTLHPQHFLGQLVAPEVHDILGLDI